MRRKELGGPFFIVGEKWGPPMSKTGNASLATFRTSDQETLNMKNAQRKIIFPTSPILIYFRVPMKSQLFDQRGQNNEKLGFSRVLRLRKTASKIQKLFEITSLI